MKILVTGHKGYIGTVLVPMLLEKEYDVVGMDTDLFGGSTFGTGIVEIPEIKKDIRDVEMSDLQGIDIVMHLAALSNDPLGDLNPDLTYEINHKASVRIAKFAKQAGTKRFIFSSSCSNYGAGGETLLDESSEFNPVTPYGKSKVLVEKEVSKLADDNFSPIFLRNATAYGVSPRIRFDLVLNNLVAWAYATGRIYLKSDGTPWRPIVHIEDISRAFIAVAEAPLSKVHNLAFNVGRNEDNYRIKELADIVAEVVPNCKVEYAEGAGPDKRCYRVDCGKILRTLPNFEPQWNARKGAEELYQAVRNIGVTTEEFEGPKYKRIAHIQQLIDSQRLDKDLRWTRQ